MCVNISNELYYLQFATYFEYISNEYYPKYSKIRCIFWIFFSFSRFQDILKMLKCIAQRNRVVYVKIYSPRNVLSMKNRSLCNRFYFHMHLKVNFRHKNRSFAYTLDSALRTLAHIPHNISHSLLPTHTWKTFRISFLCYDFVSIDRFIHRSKRDN